MLASSAGLAGLAAFLISPASAFLGTHPLLGFSNGACSEYERLHLSIPGLHADDLALMDSAGSQSAHLQKSFSEAQQRVYKPYLLPSEDLQHHIDELFCASKETSERLVRVIQLDDISDLIGQERVERLQSLGADIASTLRELPEAHLVTLSSHPEAMNLHSKRQLVAPDVQEIEDALERIMASESEDSDSSDEQEGVVKEEPQDWNLDDWLPTATHSGSSEAMIVPTRPAVVYQEASASASSSLLSSASALPSSSSVPRYTSTPLPSNAALVEKYAITTPNLVFAIGLFLFIFLPLGLFAVSALSSIEAPYGLENKMTGSVMSADKKDQ